MDDAHARTLVKGAPAYCLGVWGRATVDLLTARPRLTRHGTAPYFPKGVDVSGFSQAQLNEVARRLNERPRETLDFETPIERYRHAVALTS